MDREERKRDVGIIGKKWVFVEIRAWFNYEESETEDENGG